MASPAPVNLYTMTIPPILRSLHSLNAILSKAETHAQETNTPLSKYLESRLYPDMAPFVYQIQSVSDISKGACVRIAGIPTTVMPDTETTFEELHGRIEKTIELLKGVKEEDFAGQEGKAVALKHKMREWKMDAKEYILTYVIPTFYFHVTVAYAILRHCGVPVGMFDYLGQS